MSSEFFEHRGRGTRAGSGVRCDVGSDEPPRHQLVAFLASGRTGGRVDIRVSLAAPDRAALAAIAGRETPVESETCEEHERECRHEGCGQRVDRGKRDKAANEEACGQTV